MRTELVDAGDSAHASEQQEFSALDVLYLRAMAEMLAGHDPREVGKAVGYSDRHIRRWKQTARWRELWNMVAGEQVSNLRAQLIGLGGNAIKSLRSLVDDASEKGAPTRAYVAFGILDRIQHVAPAADEDKEIRRIISRIPRSTQLTSTPDTSTPDNTPEVLPMDAETGEAILPGQGDLSRARESVRLRRISERRDPATGRFGSYRVAGEGDTEQSPITPEQSPITPGD